MTVQESITQSVSLEVPYDTAFAYISNPRNQPKWAINFVKEVKETDQGLIMVTPMGEVPFRFESDSQSGVIDIVMGGGAPLPTRLVRNGDGCEFMFTLFRPEGMPEEAWQGQAAGLAEELGILKLNLETMPVI